MSEPRTQETVGEIVTKCPALSRVFEEVGIDYCCGGKKTLEQACAEKGLDLATVMATLATSSAAKEVSLADPDDMSLTELADHIEQTHHAYLRREMPRLDYMTKRVATVHGENDARLQKIQETFAEVVNEMTVHMMKEEKVLFPMIRQLEASDSLPVFHCGSLANPIRQMESEHHGAGSALEQLSSLSDGYTPPDWACNTYRAMLDGLAQFQLDLHQHVHKEESILFPKALAHEAKLAGGAA